MSSPPRPACPACGRTDNVRWIVYGMPAGMPDPELYAIGGCCIQADGTDPQWRCLLCHLEWTKGWDEPLPDTAQGNV